MHKVSIPIYTRVKFGRRPTWQNRNINGFPFANRELSKVLRLVYSLLMLHLHLHNSNHHPAILVIVIGNLQLLKAAGLTKAPETKLHESNSRKQQH